MENNTHRLKGRKQTIEHVEKRMSKIRGVCSEKRKLASTKNGFQKGNINWNKGKIGIYSESAKTKMREAKLGKLPPPHKAGCQCFRCSPKKGKLNHNYVNGCTDERNRLRRELRQWSRDVLIRDSFNCVMCHTVGGRLNAHHIKRFSDYPELRLDINNGVTLCEICHKSVMKKEQEYEDMFISLLKVK
jgi:5-methylcytosine-specific restriction endonuclease McrA